MAAEPLVSVIVPAYNVEKYLDKCVSSILQQSYKNIEIIIVDDGSTDTTGYISDSWAESTEKVFSYHKSNEGESLTRAYGVEKAKGELIAWVDADDWIEPDYLEKMTEKMRIDPQIDISLGLFIQEELDGKVFWIPRIEPQHYLDNRTALTELFEVAKWGGGSCVKVMRKSLYEGFQANVDLRFGSDLVNAIGLIKKARKVFYTGVCKYHYVKNPDSQCNSINYSYQLQYLKFYDEYCHGDAVKNDTEMRSAVRKRAWGAYQYAMNELRTHNYVKMRDIYSAYDQTLRKFMEEVLSEFPENDVIWEERRKRYGNMSNGLTEYLDKYWTDMRNASKLYIFGAGEYAKKAWKFLKVNDIDFEGFVISDGQLNKNIPGKPVYYVSEIVPYKEETELLIGLDEDHTRELYPQIESIGFNQLYIL